jgi:DNA-binding IclR family transcriptional regulator
MLRSDSSPEFDKVPHDGQSSVREPRHHRTVDRVTRILEEVVYHPGIVLADLARTLDAPKSSIYGFLRGLLAQGWLFEDDNRYYLGPAVYGLTLASGHIRAGMVTHEDLTNLYGASRLTVLLGVQASDYLVWIAEAGIDQISGYEARSNIRRTLLSSATGKALLAAKTEAERAAYLRRRKPDEAELVYKFLGEYDEIKRTRIAKNVRLAETRSVIATAVYDQFGEAVAAVALAGPTPQIESREAELRALLLEHVDLWRRRSPASRGVI